MKNILGLVIAISFAVFYFIALLSPINIISNYDNIFSILLLVCFISAIIVIALIVFERIKEKGSEKDDIDKYR